MTSTGPPPPSGGDNRNLGPIVVGVNWMVFGPATILVCLRLGTRTWITRNLGWDDFTILLAHVSPHDDQSLPGALTDRFRSSTVAVWAL